MREMVGGGEEEGREGGRERGWGERPLFDKVKKIYKEKGGSIF